MKKPQVLLKRCFVISICVLLLLFYYVGFNIVWKPNMNLIQQDKTEQQTHQQQATQMESNEQNLQFDKKPIQSWERNEKEETKQTTRTNVIILSQGRGGSSFLGGIFNCNLQVMYWFEPLFNVGKLLNVNLFMEKEPFTYKDTCVQLIDSFFKCDFSNITNATLSLLSASTFRLHSKALTSGYLCPDEEKSNGCALFSNTLLSKACKSYKHTVIKILSPRLPNNTIESLQEHFSHQSRYDVKFINLVRDPRAVVYSWVESNWIKNHLDQGFRVNVHKICDPIEKNVRMGLISPPPWLRNRFKVIRYEDLVVNTANIAQELYRFAGFDWSVSVDKWITDHQIQLSSAVKQNPYSLYRNASAAMNKWKQEAPGELITIVEDVCGGLMNIMGYSKWNKTDR